MASIIIIISHVKKICSSSCDNVFSYYQLNSVASQHFFLTLILIVFFHLCYYYGKAKENLVKRKLMASFFFIIEMKGRKKNCLVTGKRKTERWRLMLSYLKNDAFVE